MKPRIIFHVDMDAFFASCEEAVNPSLKGRPLIVGGTKKDLRSIVSCPNYLARKRGIKTAMSIAGALLLAPDGNFIRGTRGLYSDYSVRVRKIFYKYTPVVEPVSIDEAYLDVTEVLHPFKGDYVNLAMLIKEEIKSVLNITCSIGVSSNMVCSKIASKENKPDGITLVPFGREKEFLAPLPVERIPGVGKAALKKLHRYGIRKIGDILNHNQDFYETEIGYHSGYLLRVASGIDDRQVVAEEEYSQKSLSKENTLMFDTSDKTFLKKELYYLLEKACARLRRKNLKSDSLTVKVKYSDFTVNQKSGMLPQFTNLEVDCQKSAAELLGKLLSGSRKIRLIGVRFGGLVDDDDSAQENLFVDTDKYRNLLKNMDKLRKKYDYNIIKFGKTFDING